MISHCEAGALQRNDFQFNAHAVIRRLTPTLTDQAAATILTKQDQKLVDLPGGDRQHDRSRGHCPPPKKHFCKNLCPFGA